MKIKQINKYPFSTSILLLLLTVFIACETDFTPLVSLGLNNEYILPRMKTLLLQPGLEGKSYQWTMQTENGSDSIVGTEKDYIFLEEKTGTYHLRFQILDGITPIDEKITIYVVEEQVTYSPYISIVYEYRPAPGQFVNQMPLYEDGDTEESMRRKAEESIRGDIRQGVSLGSFGGYIIFGFDHTLINSKGKRDFHIEGNAFFSTAFPEVEAGSSESGIILVSFDENQNGIPDDKWYEIDWYPEVTKEIAYMDYEITYSRPDENKTPDPGHDSITDKSYIPWNDNLGKSGYVMKNRFHDQSYYPLWLEENEMVFQGTRLPNNASDISGDGSYYLQFMFPQGAYVDNYPEGSMDKEGNYRNHFDIDWAVDIETRERVHLKGIDFIKVYTGQNQYCGHLGETSTEIFSARDLHLTLY